MDFRVFTEPQNGATYFDQLAAAQAAEQLGFDAFFRSDHYLAMSGDGGVGSTDAWTTLAGLARETSRITLGTLVSSVTYRLPGVLAIQVAQVDAMSGGRAELGLGTGWFEAEHRAYGIPFPAKRFGLLEEQLQIVTGLWSTPPGQTFSFAGEHFQLTDSPALPKPARLPLPVIVGGGGLAKTPRLAATYASEYNIGFVSDEDVAAAYDRVRAACRDAGRDPATLTLSYAATTLGGRTANDISRRAEKTGANLDSLATSGFGGSAAAIVDRLGRLGALGASRIYFQIMDMTDLDHLEFLASDVIPQLA